MKLVTYSTNNEERFGILLEHPATNELWVFDPEKVEDRLYFYASRATSPFLANRPSFLLKRPWPRSLTDFLALGDQGMDAARRLQDYLLNFLQQSDQALLVGAGYPLKEVKLRAPIPRPRLFFGLVQNSPTFIRHNDRRPVVNVYPQGHQRPQGSLVSPGEPVYVAPDMDRFGWTPEPGCIIGRQGRNIPVSEAMQHIAGFTLVMDMVHSLYDEEIMKNSEQSLRRERSELDWFEDATGSWLGKKSDTMGAMGPYLTTKEEVGNPYDLLLYSRQSGWQRDRAHTGSMVIGFERLVSWLSSFMTLQPGDVLHMGTLAVDGMPYLSDIDYGPEDYIEGDWERVGTLRIPVVFAKREDWRAPDDPGRIHPVPAVRDLLDTAESGIDAPDAWLVDKVRHFWTVFGNYHDVERVEGLKVSGTPRVLNCPASALTNSGSTVVIPARANDLHIGVELAFVVNRVAHGVSLEDAADYILGYLPMAALRDSSFADIIQQPASPQEQNLPVVYARWADGFNVVGGPPLPLSADETRGRTMRLTLEGVGEIECNSDEYVLTAPQVLAFLTKWITVFPGDVITLGRTAEMLTVPAGHPLVEGTQLTAQIDGIGSLSARFDDQRDFHSDEDVS